MTYQDIVQQHIDLFGVEPIITGARYWDDVPLDIRVLRAIEAGQPYVEEAVEEGTVI